MPIDLLEKLCIIVLTFINDWFFRFPVKEEKFEKNFQIYHDDAASASGGGKNEKIITVTG